MMEPPPPEGQSSPKNVVKWSLSLVFTPDVDDSWDKLKKGMLKNRFNGSVFCFNLVLIWLGMQVHWWRLVGPSIAIQFTCNARSDGLFASYE